MADSADQATQLEEMERSAALMRRAPSGPVATGQCLWCDSDVEDGRRWCDAECRDEWERFG